MYEYFDFDLSQASFEWDERKDQINFAKHGIHFKTAVKVFLDPNKLIREDEEHPEELRYDILGKIGKVLFVVCAFKEENVVRMISGRIATPMEKERYRPCSSSASVFTGIRNSIHEHDPVWGKEPCARFGQSKAHFFLTHQMTFFADPFPLSLWYPPYM